MAVGPTSAANRLFAELFLYTNNYCSVTVVLLTIDRRSAIRHQRTSFARSDFNGELAVIIGREICDGQGMSKTVVANFYLVSVAGINWIPIFELEHGLKVDPV